VTLPKSIGRLCLSSRDSRTAPHIHCNFFDDQDDLDRLGEAVRLSPKSGRTAPFSDLIEDEMAPGNAVADGTSSALQGQPTFFGSTHAAPRTYQSALLR